MGIVKYQTIPSLWMMQENMLKVNWIEITSTKILTKVKYNNQLSLKKSSISTKFNWYRLN